MSLEIGYLEGSRVAVPVAKAADVHQYPLTEGCLSRLPLLAPWLEFKSICRILVSHCIQTIGELLGDPLASVSVASEGKVLRGVSSPFLILGEIGTEPKGTPKLKPGELIQP